jgi:hypothetical protein
MEGVKEMTDTPECDKLDADLYARGVPLAVSVNETRLLARRLERECNSLRHHLEILHEKNRELEDERFEAHMLLYSLRNMVTTEQETKDSFIKRVRRILYPEKQ